MSLTVGLCQPLPPHLQQVEASRVEEREVGEVDGERAQRVEHLTDTRQIGS